MKKMTATKVAQIAKALGVPNRLAIYTHIAQHDELYCGEMHTKVKIGLATLSHHLKVLTELELITARREGLNMFYRTVPETFSAYLAYLHRIGPEGN